MPRQRKPQSGAQRFWTGRVANTTTGSTTTQTVYRIPTGRWRCDTECTAYEIIWTTPIRVAIEGENIYNISLDPGALKTVIENFDELELSNVTLETIEWDVTFKGNITAEGTFTWTEVAATDLTATNGTITNLTSTEATITTLTATTSSLWTATSTSMDTETLAVSWTSTLTWAVTAESDLTVNWTLSAWQWDITALSSETANIWTLTVSDWATVDGWLTANSTTTDTLTVNETSTFTGDVSAGNITSNWTTTLDTLIVSWATTLNTLTATWASTFNGNASVAWNLSVTGNETVTGNVTVTGDGIFSNDVSVANNLNVSGDTTLTDDLTINWTTHLKDLETTGSVDIGWTLRTTWAAVIGNWLNVTGQMESDTVRTNEIIANEVRVTDWLYLSQGAEAPDFVLQSEKGEPNGVAPLNSNGIVPAEHLPPIYTSAIVKVGSGSFSNSNTSTVIDPDITSDSYVHISNYQDILWDLDENIIPGSWSTPGQITVVSNQVENGTYKYIVVNPLTSCNS